MFEKYDRTDASVSAPVETRFFFLPSDITRLGVLDEHFAETLKVSQVFECFPLNKATSVEDG